jgi:hypothetical protein
VEQGEPPCPVWPRRSEGVGHRDPHPAQHALWPNAIGEGRVVYIQRGLSDHKVAIAARGDVEIVYGGYETGGGGEGHVADHGGQSRAIRKPAAAPAPIAATVATLTPTPTLPPTPPPPTAPTASAPAGGRRGGGHGRGRGAHPAAQRAGDGLAPVRDQDGRADKSV